MKAACVLVCLALAHGITGSIFKYQERVVNGIDVQDLDYIDTHQRTHRYQATESQKKQYQPSESQEKQSQSKESHEKRYQSKESQEKRDQSKESQEKRYQSKESQEKRYQSTESQEKRYKPTESQEKRYQSTESQEKRYQSKESQEKQDQSKESQEKRYQSKESQEKRDQSKESQVKRYQSKESQEKRDQSKESQEKRDQSKESQEKRYQSKESQEKRDQSKESQEKRYQSKESQENRDQSKESQEKQYYKLQNHRSKYLQNQRYRNQKEQDQTYHEREKLSQASQYQQNLPSYQDQEQYQKSASLNSHEWPSTHQHSRHSQYNNDKHRHNSHSSESSQESKERKNSKEQLSTSRADNQKWKSPVFDSVSQFMNMDKLNSQVYGNKMRRMAVGPKSPVQTQEDIQKIFGDAQKAMRHIQEEEKVKFHEVFEVAKQENNEDAQLNATQLAQKYQYLVEEHTVKTKDGYMLTVFRIPPKKQIRDVQKKPVVFLMHGILGSADDWLLMGPGKSLAYLLSDAGYDVWLGNARGNKYSKRHVSRYSAMADFWQFGTDEIALIDLPAMIDYALKTTKQERLYYIGHALGTTAFFALTATRPEYNDKIIMMYALSPMVYMTNVRSPLFRMVAPTSKFQERLSRLIGNEDFTPTKELIRTLGGAMCEKEIGCKKVCSNVNFVMAGVNVDGMDSNIIPVVMKHLPAGTSAMVIKQYGQGVDSHEFRRYNYGSYINKKVYGTVEAPKYNIAEVQAPVTLYYSEEDWLAHPKDVARLEKELPNVRETNKVSDKHFSHMDFQFSSKAPEMVYQKIIESMQNQE